VARVLIVFGAGGAGSVARYLVGLAVGRRDFPYATLTVNLVGSFMIAFVLELALGHSLRGVVNVGLTVLGAFAAGLAGLYLARRVS
jgi:CrcB protein